MRGSGGGLEGGGRGCGAGTAVRVERAVGGWSCHTESRETDVEGLRSRKECVSRCTRPRVASVTTILTPFTPSSRKISPAGAVQGCGPDVELRQVGRLRGSHTVSFKHWSCRVTDVGEILDCVDVPPNVCPSQLRRTRRFSSNICSFVAMGYGTHERVRTVRCRTGLRQ